MDIRTDLINDIVNSMQSQLDNNQLQDLKNSLYLKLNKYEIHERETSLSVIDTSSEMLLKQFIATKRLEGKAESTIKHYGFVCGRMIQDINKNICDITTFDLRFYLSSYKELRNISNVTLDGMRRCIKSFFTFLYTENLINTNPSAALHQVKCEKKIKHPFTDRDLEKLKRSCQNRRDRALVEFLYSTGCRISEVISLNRDDINFDNNSIVVSGKGSKQRIVYMTDVCAMYLQEYLEERTDDNPCLFATLIEPYRRMQKTGLEARLHKIGNIAGVDNVHPHRYRRTLATNMLNRGANIQDVACILGHEDIRTTQIYCFIDQNNVMITHNKYIS